MTVRISTGLRNHMLGGGSFKDAFEGGRMEVYSGTQPASADSAVAGTLLCTFTDNAGSWTAETPASGSVALTGGSSGSIDDITIDGVSILDTVVAYNTSLSQTAADLAAALNASATNKDWIASANSATVTLTARPGRGARFNGLTLATTATTITKTDSNPSGGAASVNGLKFDAPANGSISKRAGQTWSGTAAASGSAGWFRLYGPATDAGGADAAGTKLRYDGAIATSGAQLNVSSTSITKDAVQTISTFAPTMPAQP